MDPKPIGPPLIGRTFGAFAVVVLGSVAWSTDAGAQQISTPTLGLETRGGFTDNSLFYDRTQEGLDTAVLSDIEEKSIGAFAQQQIRWTPMVRSEVGIRGDFFDYSVLDNQVYSGVRSENAAIFSPNASLIFSAAESTDVFVNFAMSFQSAVDSDLARAFGYELGARTQLFDRLDLGTSVRLLDVDRSQRQEVGLEGRLTMTTWLHADLDLTLSRGHLLDLSDTRDDVLSERRVTLGGALSAIHPNGVFGRVGAFYRTDTRRYAKIDATLGYGNDTFEVSVTAHRVTSGPPSNVGGSVAVFL